MTERDARGIVGGKNTIDKKKNKECVDSLSFCFSDFLNRLLKLRKKKTDPLKAGKNKAKIINNFDLSDDEDKHRRTKKVSFLKTQRISSPSNGTTASESQEKNELLDSYTAARDSSNGSASSQRSTDDTQFKNACVDSADPQITRESSSKSLSYQTSDDTLLDMPLPLPSDSSMVETPGPEQKSSSAAEESSQTSQLSTCDLNHTASAGLFSLIHNTAIRNQCRFYI